MPLRAHTPNDTGDWHDLLPHLREVGETAHKFALRFGGGDLGSTDHAQSAAALAEWAGDWHDIGKAGPFQDYLLACHEAKQAGRRPPRPGTAPHAVWGAIIARSLKKNVGDGWRDLALPIAGHHAGLHSEIEQKLIAVGEGANLAPFHEVVRALGKPKRFSVPTDPHRRELRVRMVLSALADADYLDTERHFDRPRAARRAGYDRLQTLADRLDRSQRELMSGLRDPDAPVNRIRREVYDACLARASEPPGLFRLAVPTGGGKTRSGLAFALQHALAHGLDRIVVAIPYTSIIDQTAAVYAEVVGAENVLVHHSQVPEPPTRDAERQDEDAARHRLATENWDAPLVVTTTVQLFESLFTRYPGRARKLHRLARSVIVLDEVQALPHPVLLPTLDVLRALTDDYGTSVVLCTATQPGFERSAALPPFQGAAPVPIVWDPAPHFEALDRVSVEHRPQSQPLAGIADEIANEEQALVILNSRRDAVGLAEALRERLGESGGLFHLSTLLCGAHRRQVLRRVRQRLAAGLPVRLVSTQVVEAGVDLDFPVVYRALGPLDRIVQAAGRCNREGRLGTRGGRLVVFEPEGGRAPAGAYASGTGLARVLLAEPDPLGQANLDRYFALLFDEIGRKLDEHEIQDLRRDLDFEAVQRLYRLIPDDTEPVVVLRDWTRSGAPTDPGALSSAAEARLARWRERPDRHGWRRLGPFTVSVYSRQLGGMEASPHFETLDERLHAWRGTYDPLLGLPLSLDDPADLAYDPGLLIT